MKLLNPDKEAGQSPNKMINRLDPLRQTASTAPYSKADDVRSSDEFARPSNQNTEEMKSPRQINTEKPSVHEMNAVRQSEPFFLKKSRPGDSTKMQQRFGTHLEKSGLNLSQKVLISH